MADKEMSPKAESVLNYVKRAELTPEELGEVVAGLTLLALGKAFNDALGELGGGLSG